MAIELRLSQTGSTLTGSASSFPIDYSVSGSVTGTSVRIRLTIIGGPEVAGLYFDLNGVVAGGRITGTFTSTVGGEGTFVAVLGGAPPPPPQAVSIQGDWILTTTNNHNGFQTDWHLSLTQNGIAVSGTVVWEAGGSYPGTVDGLIVDGQFQLLMTVTVLPGPSDPQLTALVKGTATSTQLTGTWAVMSENGASGPAVGRRPGTPPPPPPPPPPQQGFTLRLKNTAHTAMTMTVDSRSPVSIAAGDTYEVNFPANPGSVSYTASTSGRTAQGTQVGLLLTWSDTLSTTGSTSRNIDLVVNSSYFFLRIDNQSSYALNNLIVNYDLLNETRDAIRLEPGGLYGVGYYRAFSNSRVRLDMVGTSRYMYWDNLSLPMTTNQSVLLRATN